MNRLIALALLVAAPAWAALPPQAQNLRDLDTMVRWLQHHPHAANTVQRIDLQRHTIEYGDHCVVIFKRDAPPSTPGWVGPVGALRFERSNCPIVAPWEAKP